MHPDFAELFAFIGEDQFQKTRFTGARYCYKKALELIPDYARALVGLGNIYFYALEDWEKALEQYEAALKWDPTNTAALFGKGSCLHHLGKYAESIAAMDQTLQSDLTRNGRASHQSIRYYRTETNYYKGSNYSAMGNKKQARVFVDIAKGYTANSEHVNYLSGLLYFDAGQKKEAQEKFQRLLQRGTSICNTRYYLGRIYDEQGDPSALDHFLGACSCMQVTIRNIERQLKSVSGMDLELDEKVVLEGRMERKLFNFRLESAALIAAMIRIVENSENPKNKSCKELMIDVLGRIQPTAGP